MRESELGQGKMQIVVVKDIEIDRARGVERMLALASKGLLDALKSDKQVKRRQGAGDFDGRIEKTRRARRAVHRLGFINARAQKGATILVEGIQMSPRRLKEMKALVQIRTERDANPHFRPRTSCMS
jgi:hypothetical protein